MRTAIIPVVMISFYKEEPELVAFDEGASEQEICAILAEDFQLMVYCDLEEVPTTIDQINDASDQCDMKLLHLETKVKCPPIGGYDG